MRAAQNLGRELPVTNHEDDSVDMATRKAERVVSRLRRMTLLALVFSTAACSENRITDSPSGSIGGCHRLFMGAWSQPGHLELPDRVRLVAVRNGMNSFPKENAVVPLEPASFAGMGTWRQYATDSLQISFHEGTSGATMTLHLRSSGDWGGIATAYSQVRPASPITASAVLQRIACPD